MDTVPDYLEEVARDLVSSMAVGASIDSSKR